VQYNLNTKLSKYKDYPFRLYFVATGATFEQHKIDELMKKKINKLPTNIKCVTFNEFKKECSRYIKPLIMGIKYQSIQQLKLL